LLSEKPDNEDIEELGGDDKVAAKEDNERRGSGSTASTL